MTWGGHVFADMKINPHPCESYPCESMDLNKSSMGLIQDYRHTTPSSPLPTSRCCLYDFRFWRVFTGRISFWDCAQQWETSSSIIWILCCPTPSYLLHQNLLLPQASSTCSGSDANIGIVSDHKCQSKWHDTWGKHKQTTETGLQLTGPANHT